MKRASIRSMNRVGLFLFAAAPLIPVWAQSGAEAYLLPATVHLSGIVTDTAGNPLPDTWIDHTGIKAQSVKVNQDGRFAIETRAPAIVFRAKGFNGEYYRVMGDAYIEIKLESMSRSLNSCSRYPPCVQLNGFESVFCFPKVRGVSVTKQRYDIDYVVRNFLIPTSAGKRGIGHAAGPMWGDGRPHDRDVWSAVEYSETDYPDPEGSFIVDARGKTSDGKYWRLLGHVFESAAYRDLSADEADLLDKVFDGVCLLPYPPRE